MPQAAMLYARRMQHVPARDVTASFNAASGNAIRATRIEKSVSIFDGRVSMPQAAMLYARPHLLEKILLNIFKFQCRKRQCYTRDSSLISLGRGNFLFQCRKRQCYTRDWLSLDSFECRWQVSMPQAAMLYARQIHFKAFKAKDTLFQCRKRQCYTRDVEFKLFNDSKEMFQCRKRQCYTRDMVP